MKNYLTTLAAIITAFATVPIAVGEYSKHIGRTIYMADWFYIVCVSCGVIGPVFGLLFAKDYNTHPTQEQVDVATAQKVVDAAKKIADSEVPVLPTEPKP